MRFCKLIVLLLTISGNFVSYADDGIAELKLGCKNPGAYHNQLPPSDIKVECSDERFEWVPAGADEATIHNRRTVCSKATTNKPNINEEMPDICTPCSWPDTDFKCDGFKEVCKTVEMTFSVTCDQVLEMESINKFCQTAILAETVATQEKIMAIKETGRTKKLCGVQDFMNGKPITPVSQR
jgi:hypothetical protein